MCANKFGVDTVKDTKFSKKYFKPKKFTTIFVKCIMSPAANLTFLVKYLGLK